jgi:ssDNA-binding Zn-finger/Zn-ribbon topoisomerase 1
LVERTNRATGEGFLGCDHYPECRFTRPLTEYLKMVRLGAPTLF